MARPGNSAESPTNRCSKQGRYARYGSVWLWCPPCLDSGLANPKSKRSPSGLKCQCAHSPSPSFPLWLRRSATSPDPRPVPPGRVTLGTDRGTLCPLCNPLVPASTLPPLDHCLTCHCSTSPSLAYHPILDLTAQLYVCFNGVLMAACSEIMSIIYGEFTTFLEIKVAKLVQTGKGSPDTAFTTTRQNQPLLYHLRLFLNR